ncbi:MAG: hypothetical protein GY765_22265, partial [bacterium]|nr:hypothetical protein [bacterium]
MNESPNSMYDDLEKLDKKRRNTAIYIFIGIMSVLTILWYLSEYRTRQAQPPPENTSGANTKGDAGKGVSTFPFPVPSLMPAGNAFVELLKEHIQKEQFKRATILVTAGESENIRYGVGMLYKATTNNAYILAHFPGAATHPLTKKKHLSHIRVYL